MRIAHSGPRIARVAASILLALALMGGAGQVAPRVHAAAPPVNSVFRPLLPKLRGLTIPVLLPAYLPRQSQGRIYATLDDHSAFAYLINLSLDPGCHGANACRFGEVTGGPEIDTPTIFDYPRGQHVRLRNGSLALYFPYHCGASCGDSVLAFQADSIVYTVSVKAGSLDEVLVMANSIARAT